MTQANSSLSEPLSELSLIKFLFPTLDYVDIASFAVNTESGLILCCNQRLCSDLRKTREEITGHTYEEVFWEDFSTRLRLLMEKSTFSGPVSEVYYWTWRMLWGQLTIRKVKTFENSVIALVTITDITEIGRSEYEYRRMAFYDQQLDLPNGRQLELDAAALANQDDVALIHFDINFLAGINDVYGWGTGDFLLTQIRNWLATATMPGDSGLYRVNEDTFAILARHISLPEAKKLARQILRRFTKPWQSLNNLPNLYCNITVGVIYGHYVGADAKNQLFRMMERNVYPGDYMVYDATMDARHKKRILLRQTLINCMQQNMEGFSVVFQPIVDAKTENWVGAEALCRWNAPGLGHISPLIFIEELEQLGLITQLDTWVMETAVRQCAEWGLGGKNFFLDVNLSPVQILNKQFLEDLQNLLKVYHFPNEKLCLEITESKKFNFSPANVALLNRLRATGIRISLDDFGTGYSSFQNLRLLPAYVLKTEKAFIDNLEKDSYLQYLLSTMVNLAHAADMKIICEGVEMPHQQEILKGFGADYFQGYLFSRPLSVEKMRKKLARFL